MGAERWVNAGRRVIGTIPLLQWQAFGAKFWGRGTILVPQRSASLDAPLSPSFTLHFTQRFFPSWDQDGAIPAGGFALCHLLLEASRWVEANRAGLQPNNCVIGRTLSATVNGRLLGL